jgi:hypothetical protein
VDSSGYSMANHHHLRHEEEEEEEEMASHRETLNEVVILLECSSKQLKTVVQGPNSQTLLGEILQIYSIF